MYSREGGSVATHVALFDAKYREERSPTARVAERTMASRAK